MVNGGISLGNFELTRLFVVVVSLLGASHVCGFIFNKFKMPRVIGEIAGGIILGPSVLGVIAPGAHSWLFGAFPDEERLLSLIYWFGLIFLMFISGFEMQRVFSPRDKHVIRILVVCSTFIPLCLGWLSSSVFDFSLISGPKANLTALKIVVAVAVAITSIPVLSKMFVDMRIIDTWFAKIVLTTATIHDLILWVALSVATSLSAGAYTQGVMTEAFRTVAFFAAALFIFPGLLAVLTGTRFNLLLKSSPLAYVLSVCFMFTAFASILKVNIIFGAFLAGVALGSLSGGSFRKENDEIKAVAMAFFIPVYFALVGTKLDFVNSLNAGFSLSFMAFAMAASAAGTFAAARLLNMDLITGTSFAAAMNARGGPGIILATVAYESGIINSMFFLSLVLMSLFTSLVAGYWLRFALDKGYKLYGTEKQVS